MVRISVPASSRWVAKLCLRVWQVTRVSMPAARAAAVTAFCTAVSWTWNRTGRPVAGSTQGRDAGNRYYHAKLDAAPGSFSRSA